MTNITSSKVNTIPSYEEELKWCDDQFYSYLVRFIKKQPGYVVDIPMLQKAYEKAKALHGQSRRHSGLLYLRHPLAVAKSLAKSHCKTSVLVAGLLHDTMEDCDYAYEALREDFWPEVADIVSAVTEIKKVEKDVESRYVDMSPEERHATLDRLTDARLIKSPYQREAFLVRFADREHNLKTIDACSPDKRRVKIEQTKAFLIPAAKKLGILYYEVKLNDYCMKFGHEAQRYQAIKDQRNRLISVASGAAAEFDAVLASALNQQDFFFFPLINPFAEQRAYVVESRRDLCPYEIAQQLPLYASSFERQDCALHEIILVCDSTDKKKMMTSFMNLCKEHLKEHDVFLDYKGENDDTLSFLLTDKAENGYNIITLPAQFLNEHFCGDVENSYMTLVSDDALGDALRQTMTVYAYSPYKGIREFKNCVPVGATALDFAFLISTALALTVKSAHIKNRNLVARWEFSEDDYIYPLRTVLNDGDVVYFEADYTVDIKGYKNNATIDWFDFVNTEKARRDLIRYFKELRIK